MGRSAAVACRSVGRIGHAGHDDVGAQCVHHPAGFVDAAGRGDGEVQARQDGLAARVAVFVVVDDQHERGVPHTVAVAPSTALGGAAIRTASMVR